MGWVRFCRESGETLNFRELMAKWLIVIEFRLNFSVIVFDHGLKPSASFLVCFLWIWYASHYSSRNSLNFGVWFWFLKLLSSRLVWYVSFFSIKWMWILLSTNFVWTKGLALSACKLHFLLLIFLSISFWIWFDCRTETFKWLQIL